jgi:signal transduction histidine kinase
VGVYSGYTILQLQGLKRLQAESIDRNRTDSLLLLRIQNSLNSLGLAMRDMLDATEPYPLTGWEPQFKRLKADLDDAVAREEKYVPQQRRYLLESFAQFWDAASRIFGLAREGREADARAMIQLSLQARQAALSTAVARLLVQNNESEQQAAARTQEIYDRAERNVYIFLGAMLILILMTGLYLVQYNRRMFGQVAEISERRSELARQLISMQENTFRSISRELHDDFGQILTAIGALLRRTARHSPAVAEDLGEVREIVQSTLEKVRSLSHTLHPVALDDMGLENALAAYLQRFRKQTGIDVRYEKVGETRDLESGVATHLYRVVQEALNNVARHSKSTCAEVRLRFLEKALVLEVEDDGVGFKKRGSGGLGLVSMRERTELFSGTIAFLDGSNGGALVRVTVPLTTEGASA